MRTFTLTERCPNSCCLTPADVDFLLAEHRTHVAVVPTGRRGWYQLTPIRHVGTILCPSCRLVLRPKIPVRNLFHLLDPTGVTPQGEDRTAAHPELEVLDFLAGRLAQLLAERVAAGLQRGYAERVSQGPFLQGQLDVPGHLREGLGHRDQFHCRHDDFTVNLPCNQIPKATVERVLRVPLLSEEVRTALRQSLRAFATVDSLPLNRESFAAARLTRLTEAYGPLLELCQLLADNLAGGETEGAVSCPAFLLDMERIFERFLTRRCLKTFDASAGSRRGYTVSVQPTHLVAEAVPGQPELTIRPDLTLDRAGVPRVVLDAKWKLPSRSPLVTADLYQLLAYCTALGVRRGVLVYPGRRSHTAAYQLQRSPIRITTHRVRVVGSRMAIERSVQRMLRTL